MKPPRKLLFLAPILSALAAVAAAAAASLPAGASSFERLRGRWLWQFRERIGR